MPLEEVRDRDWSNKLKGKVYADLKTGATPNSIRVDDTVLIKAEKSNKLSTNFRPNPFKVVEKTGSEVTVRRVRWKRARNERTFKSQRLFKKV